MRLKVGRSQGIPLEGDDMILGDIQVEGHACLGVCVPGACVPGGHVCLGGMHARGVCMPGGCACLGGMCACGGMCAWGCTCLGTCMSEGCAYLGACMPGDMHACGTCMPGDMCAHSWGMHVPRHACPQVCMTPTPVNRMTDACENITLRQTSFAGGN